MIGPSVARESPLVKPVPTPEQNVNIVYEDWEEERVMSSYEPEKHVIYKPFTRYKDCCY